MSVSAVVVVCGVSLCLGIFRERVCTHQLIGQKQSITQVHNYICILYRRCVYISVVFVDGKTEEEEEDVLVVVVRKKNHIERRMARVLANHYHSIDPLSGLFRPGNNMPVRDTNEHHTQRDTHNGTVPLSVQCKHHTAKRKFISFSGFIWK